MRIAGCVIAVSVLSGGLVAIPPAAGAPTEVQAQAAGPKAINNHPHRAGSPVQWIQHPYIEKIKNGRLAVKAQVYVDPFKAKTPRKYAKKAAKDVLQVRVRVAKKKYAHPGRSIGVLPTGAVLSQTSAKWTLRERGPMDLSVTLPKKASKRLQELSFRQRSNAISIMATQKKDTLLGAPKYGLRQVTPIELTKGKFSKATLKKYTRMAEKQVAADRGLAKAAGASLQRWNGDSPYFNVITVSNVTPFVQQISVNPNIQCMWTGASPNSNQQGVQSAVMPGGTAQFYYFATNSQSAWPGLIGATTNLSTPGTQGQLLADLSSAAKATESNIVASLESPGTYSEAGAATAAASAALTFVGKVLTAILDSPTSCNTVSQNPELFGVSTQVTGIGYTNTQDAATAVVPPANTWNGGGTTTQAGSNTGPASVPSASWAADNLGPLLGAQTSVTYYWNGGQPAPMVSNNASGTTAAGGYAGGTASYEGGLFQFVGPNPGVPGATTSCIDGSDDTQNCNYSTLGALDIQLQFLTNPNGQAGLWNQGTDPRLTVTGSSSTQYNLTCDVSTLDATLSLPFGYGGQSTNAQSSSMMTTSLNTSGQLPLNGVWMVNFFGIANVGTTTNPEYTYVYYGDEWQSAKPTVSSGYVVPGLAPNATLTEVTFAAASAGGSQTEVKGTVFASDLDNMYTATGSAIEASDLVAFGCNATPSVELPGLSIVEPAGSPTATAFGAIDASTDAGWPMPGNHTGWPTSQFTPYDSQTNWQWQWPVNQLNLTFQGLPSGDTATLP